MNLVQKFSVLFVLGLFFGCISMLDSEVQSLNDTSATICKTTITQEPYVEEVCQDVSKMEDVCNTITLNYSLSAINKTELCTEMGLCVNRYPNGTCATYYCSKGMTRCQITLTNLDSQIAGTFGMTANFTLGNSIFNKGELTNTILPNESATFDFNQFYDLDINQVKPVCTIALSKEARLQKCNIESRVTVDCKNLTKYKDVEHEICN